MAEPVEPKRRGPAKGSKHKPKAPPAWLQPPSAPPPVAQAPSPPPPRPPGASPGAPEEPREGPSKRGPGRPPAERADPKTLVAIVEKIREAFTVEDLFEIEKEVAALALEGKLPRANVRDVEQALSGARQNLKAVAQARAERLNETLVALEPMTLDQVEDFRAWREGQAPRGLAPGEPPPRPDTDPEPPA